jgi:hypothetical protein
MSSVNFELLASAAQTASMVGGIINTAGIKEMEIFVDLTAGSGTLSKFSVFLEGTSDDGTTWFELLYDTSVKNSSGAVPADEPTVTTNKRNIVGESAIVTVATKWTAQYTRFPDNVRVRVIITPTATPSETFSVKGVGKT